MGVGLLAGILTARRVVNHLSARTKGWVGKIIPNYSTGPSSSGPEDPRMARPWLEHYDDGVPAPLAPSPPKPLVDIVKATAAERPRHTAAVFKGGRLSYGELDGLSDAFAAWLAARGVVKGDRVALIMPNCPQVIIAQLGVWKAGAVAVPPNPLSSEMQLANSPAGTDARAALVP